MLLRLEHQFQSWESKVNSQPVTVNLRVRHTPDAVTHSDRLKLRR